MATIKIAYGVYNQRDKIKNENMYQLSKGATLFYLERLGNQFQYHNIDPIRIICADEIHSILNQALEEKFDYCLVVAAGCQIRNFNFHQDLINFIESHTFGVAGHPLWHTDGRWLELHHQFFIVNLNAWATVGKPNYGTWLSQDTLLPVIERSIENFHDDYTPLWVKATGQHAVQSLPCQGWELMAAMFDGGYDVITLTEKIRLSKFYTYPEHETEKFERSLRDLTPYENQNWNQNKWITDSLLVKDQIWLFNSENLNIDNNCGPYSIAVNTASGFKIFDLIKTPRLTEDAHIIIYDFNEKSLAWYKHFYMWEDNDLLECIRAFPDRDHFTWIGQWDPTYNENDGFNKNLKENFEYFGGEHQFIEYWTQFRQLPVTFYQVDLYKQPDGLTSLLHGLGKKWINLTNIFSTDATQAIFGHAECMAAQQRLLGMLYVVDPTIDVTIFDFWNRHKTGLVRDLL